MINRLLIWLGLRIGITSVNTCIIQQKDIDNFKIRTVITATDGHAYEQITWQGRNVWSQLPNINTDNIKLPKAQPQAIAQPIGQA